MKNDKHIAYSIIVEIDGDIVDKIDGCDLFGEFNNIGQAAAYAITLPGYVLPKKVNEVFCSYAVPIH